MKYVLNFLLVVCWTATAVGILWITYSIVIGALRWEIQQVIREELEYRQQIQREWETK